MKPNKKKTKNKYKQDKAYCHTDKMPYYLYVKSKEWEAKVKACCSEAKWKCEVCGSSLGLLAHHYNYLSLMRESPRDLFCLCQGCHEAYHREVKNLPTDHLTRRERLEHLVNAVQTNLERPENNINYGRPNIA